MSFDDSIFINCPFDKKYKRLLHPLIFCCLYIGLEPRLSLLADSSKSRLKNIIDLLKSCKYSIHDLSRMASSKPQEFARFNMPFELGIDVGIKSSSGDELQSKKCLVIDTDKYRYRISLSDLSGGDIASHGKRNQPEKLIRAIRDWLTSARNPIQPAASEIFGEYAEFAADLQIQLMNLGYIRSDISNLTDSEYMMYCKKWINARGQQAN